MISLKKLDTLADRPRRRKLASMMGVFQDVVKSGRVDQWHYWAQVLLRAWDAAGRPTENPVPNPSEAKLLSSVKPVGWDIPLLLETASNLKWILLESLGIDAADWNLRAPPDTQTPGRKFPIRLYLDGIRSPYNLGSIFRTAEAFGVAEVILCPGCPAPTHPRALRTSMGSTERLLWRQGLLKDLTGCVFALELGGTPLTQFAFPPAGIAILGSEEWGVCQASLAVAKKSSGIVSIPLYGGKASLSVSTAVAILLQAWTEALHY